MYVIDSMNDRQTFSNANDVLDYFEGEMSDSARHMASAELILSDLSEMASDADRVSVLRGWLNTGMPSARLALFAHVDELEQVGGGCVLYGPYRITWEN